ncbi:hypothetical protein ACSBR2_026732 [Camellia fascicularis]
MLRFSDSDKAVIREVYELMDTMLGNIKDTHSNDPIVYDLILQFVVERWDKMNIPLHCLAYILVPKYYTNSWLSKSAPGGVRKKKPHFDVEDAHPEDANIEEDIMAIEERDNVSLLDSEDDTTLVASDV